MQARGARAAANRTADLAIVVLSLGASAVAVAASARFGADPESLYVGGRLVAPISYVNAAAAFFLVGLWPALVLAARRELNPVLRALSLAAAAAMLAGWLGTQSKGGAVALAVSAVVVFAVVPGRLRLLVPTALTGVLVLSQYEPLTEPFRAQDGRRRDPPRRRGRAADRRRRARGGARLRARRRPPAHRRARPAGGDHRRRDARRGRAPRGRLAGRPPNRRPVELRAGPVGDLQALAGDGVGEQPPRQPRLQPLRLLAGEPGGLRGAPARRHRRTRLRASLSAVRRQLRDSRPRALPAAGRVARDRNRRADPAARGVRGDPRGARTTAEHRRGRGGVRRPGVLRRPRGRRLGLDLPGRGAAALRAGRAPRSRRTAAACSAAERPPWRRRGSRSSR